MINRTTDDACPSQAEIFVEKEAMLDKKLMRQTAAQHNPNELFMLRRQYDMKQASRENLNFFENGDDMHELLFKH
jgi:hypothetical protein